MAAQSLVWLWNPYKTLDLNSLGRADFTCVGSSVSKPGAPRCRWKLDVEIQREAREKLNSMAVEQPLSQATTIALEELVSLLLCTERHKNVPNQKSGRISDWSAKIRDVPDQIEAKRARKIETRRETLSQIQHLDGDSSSFQEGLREEGEEMPSSKLRRTLKSAQQDLDKARCEAEDSNTRSADLASKVIKLQDAQHQLQENNSELRRGLKSAQQDLDKARHEAEDSNTRSADLVSKVTELQDAQHQRKEKDSELRRGLKSVQQDLDKAQREAKDSNTRSADLASTVTELQDAQHQLKEDNSELRQGLEDAQLDLEKSRRETEESNTRSAKLASKVTELQDAQHQLKENNSELRLGLKSGQQELDKARREAEESNTRYADLASRFTELQNQLKDMAATYERKLDAFKKKSLKIGRLVIYSTRESRIWYHDPEVE